VNIIHVGELEVQNKLVLVVLALFSEVSNANQAIASQYVQLNVGQGLCIDHVLYGGGSRRMKVRIEDEWLWESDHAKTIVVFDWKKKVRNNKRRGKKDRVFKIEDEYMAKQFGKRVDELVGRSRWREGDMV
jgi:hypothetical protein